MYLELGFGQRAQDDRKLRRTVGLVNDLLLRFSRYPASDLLLIAEGKSDVNIMVMLQLLPTLSKAMRHG